MTPSRHLPTPSPSPSPSPETRRFWDALAEGRLTLPVCDVCRFVIWYPRELCPRCWSTAVTWENAGGRGRIHSYTVVRRARGEYAEHVPYVVAYVDLTEGPRVLANILVDGGTEPSIGAAVALDRSPAGGALLRFRLESDDTQPP